MEACDMCAPDGIRASLNSWAKIQAFGSDFTARVDLLGDVTVARLCRTLTGFLGRGEFILDVWRGPRSMARAKSVEGDADQSPYGGLGARAAGRLECVPAEGG
jgi:hypothetical protein